MKIQVMGFLSCLVFITCTLSNSEQQNYRGEADSNVVTHVVMDTTVEKIERVIKGKLLFQIEVVKFFKNGAITDIGHGETSLRYLMPLTFYKESGSLYIPDRSRNALVKYDFQGIQKRVLSIPFKDFTFYKVDKSNSLWYFLDVENGLYVIDDELRLIYKNDKSTDFCIDKSLDNLYLVNSLDEERAILDQKGVLKEQVKMDYMSFYVDKNTLIGLLQKEENIASIIREDLQKEQNKDTVSFSLDCENCFIMPTFLSNNIIISGSEKNPDTDQIHIINFGEKSVHNFLLEYPIRVDRIISEVSAGISYSGNFYFFGEDDRILYSICTDKKFIRVFTFDLNSLF